MNGVPTQLPSSKPKRVPLSVWELPKLLRSVHEFRKSQPKSCRERPHYRAILAFVHRNRMAVASQIQRRFSNYLPSDRTARRHLAEMEAMGLLAVVETNGVSPLWPKVYFVTRRGLARLKQALHDQGQEWTETLRDRRRSEGVSAQHVLHEVLTTEFLLSVWEATQKLDDLELMTTQRRSLAKNDAFKVTVAGQLTRLQPDGMFLYRQKGKGMMACFVEMDLDTMSLKQMREKFRRYQAWSESAVVISFLKNLYGKHGAANPTANFRILVVINSRNYQAEGRRLSQLLKLATRLSAGIRDRIWLTTVHNLCGRDESSSNLLVAPIWQRPRTASENHSWSIISSS